VPGSRCGLLAVQVACRGAWSRKRLALRVRGSAGAWRRGGACPRGVPYSEACVRGRADDGTAGPPAFGRPPAEAAGSAPADCGPADCGPADCGLAGGRLAPGGLSDADLSDEGLSDGGLSDEDLSAGAASDLMSMRQPVSLAASLAFWPSLPIASDSW